MDKAKKEYGALKKRAMLAKQRLKMGYWQKLVAERAQTLDKIGESDESVRLVRDLQQRQVRRDEDRALQPARADAEELLYSKVCAILEADENTTNPIGQLIDKDEFERLDESNRQRYILRLAEKFRELRERFYRERAGKSS